MPPSRKAEQSERTRAALVAASRALFAERGYVGVSAEEIAAAANVTTGAVYHQFANKRGLFLAAFEAIEEELTATVAAAASADPDPLSGFGAACLAFLDAAVTPEVRQVLMIDGRSVLGWEEWHEIMSRYGLGLTKAAVSGLLEAGLLRPAPADALAVLLFGALNEAAMFVATAGDPQAARADAAAALGVLFQSLRA